MVYTYVWALVKDHCSCANIEQSVSCPDRFSNVCDLSHAWKKNCTGISTNPAPDFCKEKLAATLEQSKDRYSDGQKSCTFSFEFLVPPPLMEGAILELVDSTKRPVPKLPPPQGVTKNSRKSFTFTGIYTIYLFYLGLPCLYPPSRPKFGWYKTLPMEA